MTPMHSFPFSNRPLYMKVYVQWQLKSGHENPWQTTLSIWFRHQQTETKLAWFKESSINIAKKYQILLSGWPQKKPNDQLATYSACLLIQTKKPGFRPKGVGDVLRRVIGNRIINCIENCLRFLGYHCDCCICHTKEIQDRVCSMQSSFDAPVNDSTSRCTNAFIWLYRQFAIEKNNLCCFRLGGLNFILGSIRPACSQRFLAVPREHQTRDRLAMEMCSGAVLPLIGIMRELHVKQKGYPHDGTKVGEHSEVRHGFMWPS